MKKKESNINTEISPSGKAIINKAIIENQARTAYRRKVVTKTTCIVLSVIFLLLLTSFGVTKLIHQKNGLLILTEQRDGRISLSETRDLANMSQQLSAQGVDHCDNITYEWLEEDLDEIMNTDGSHNGKNYFAYTFYLANTGTETVNVKSEMKVVTDYLGTTEATRIMVIKDNDINIYAKPRTSDGEKEEIPETLENFASDKVVFSNTIIDFEPESLIKYTIVIWLEGNDPECVDSILGGAVQFSLRFSIVDDQID